MSLPAVSSPSTGVAPPHAWEQLWKWWIVMLGAAGAVVALAFIFDDSINGSLRVLGLALVALLGVLYWRVGFPAMKAENERRAAIYIVSAIAIQAALLAIAPVSFMLLFGLFPQCYSSFRRLRWSIVAAMTLTIISGIASFGWGGWDTKNLPAVFVQTGFSAAFGVFFGAWITKIIDQSTKRAELIAELEATRGELAAAQREAGMRGERERLSAEIHDTLAQGFTSIVLLAQAARADETNRLDHLASIESTARDNLAEARALVADLAPVALQGAPLAEAIERVTSVFSAETGIAVSLRVTGEARTLPADHEVALLRATQESLTNARKHAQARLVDVTLTYGDEVHLAVTDDGRGFEAAHESTGFGLEGLRRRIALVGGSVDWVTAPGAGTTVSVELP